jgi:hypothetical protein
VLDRRRLLAKRKRVLRVLAVSMFTDEQMLEIRLKTATPCHFSDGPARLYRGRAVITRRWRVMRSDSTQVSGNTSQDPMS